MRAITTMKTMVHRNENKRAYLLLVFALFLWVAKGRAEDRVDAIKHQSEARQILAVEAKLTDAVATKVWERTDFTNSAIGPIQRETIRASGDILKQSQVIDPGTDIDRVVADLVDPEYFPREVVNK